MRKILAVLAACLLWAPAWADDQGSAIGGHAASNSGLAGCIYNSSPPALTTGQQVGQQCDSAGNVMVNISGGSGGTVTANQGTPNAGGTSAWPVGITPSATVGLTTVQCTVACASKITTGAHGLYALNFSATVTGTLFLYDATSCAANGTVTPLQAIAYSSANASVGVSWPSIPMIFATGIAACFSTTGPYTATASTTAFISYGYK